MNDTKKEIDIRLGKFLGLPNFMQNGSVERACFAARRLKAIRVDSQSLL